MILNASKSLTSTSCNSIERIANDAENDEESRPSSSKSSRKAKRIRFYHNGNKFFKGIVVPVAPERYRSFGSLITDLTNILTKQITLPNGVRNIFTMEGKKISRLDDLKDGKEYVCSGTGEFFKRTNYTKTDLLHCRRSAITGRSCLNIESTPKMIPAERIRPRLITLIRNGLKPRKVLRTVLNKRNSGSLEQIMSSLTETVQLDSGAVRKVFTIFGEPVTTVMQFFGTEDVFFVYGNEKYSQDDFELVFEESMAVQQYKKTPVPFNNFR